MKRTIFLVVLLLMVFSVVPASAENTLPLNGPHYNLNIIGVDDPKNLNMSGGTGHRIFVPLWDSTKIYLTKAPADESFEVLDANATDGRGEFQLPLPAECYASVVPGTTDVVTPPSCTVDYQIWARALGKPDRSASMYTCIEDPDLPGGYICSVATYRVTLTRKAGGSTWDNVTAQLLFVSADVDADGKIEHVQIFDPMFQYYYWQYDNSGLKLAQLRFYMEKYTINW